MHDIASPNTFGKAPLSTGHDREKIKATLQRRARTLLAVDAARQAGAGIVLQGTSPAQRDRSPGLRQVEGYSNVALTRAHWARRLNALRTRQGLSPIDIYVLETDAEDAERRVCEARAIERVCDQLGIPANRRDRYMDDVWIEEVSGWEFFDLDPCS